MAKCSAWDCYSDTPAHLNTNYCIRHACKSPDCHRKRQYGHFCKKCHIANKQISPIVVEKIDEESYDDQVH